MIRIEICGNIASGKTTLCNSLAGVGYSPVYEEPDRNPFLESFYQDPLAYSFETEISFALQHYHLIKIQGPSVRVACDYSMLLDMAYADVNLVDNRHRIFCEIVGELQREIDLPSKLVHISCPEKELMRRIGARARSAEEAIAVDYLISLSRAISLRVEEISSQTRVTTIDSSVINFTSGIEGIPELKPGLQGR